MTVKASGAGVGVGGAGVSVAAGGCSVGVMPPAGGLHALIIPTRMIVRKKVVRFIGLIIPEPAWSKKRPHLVGAVWSSRSV